MLLVASAPKPKVAASASLIVPASVPVPVPPVTSKAPALIARVTDLCVFRTATELACDEVTV